jgi:hypothetical protein
LFDNRIEGRANRALNTQKMPLPTMRFSFTVVAHDIHNTLQIGWHGMFRYIPCPSLPGRCHALLTHDCLLANGATVVKAGQFAKTVGVNGVTARQILRRLTGREHVFATDGAVVLVLVLEALVSVKDTD